MVADVRRLLTIGLLGAPWYRHCSLAFHGHRPRLLNSNGPILAPSIAPDVVPALGMRPIILTHYALVARHEYKHAVAYSRGAPCQD